MSYCELPEFYYDSERHARKQYPCVECCAPILVGERHLYYRGTWDGRFGTGRQHLLCRDACMAIRDDYQGGECIGFGELMSVYQETTHSSRRDRDKELRDLMAKILWRDRKHGARRRKLNGVFYQKAWGKPWAECPSEISTSAQSFNPT